MKVEIEECEWSRYPMYTINTTETYCGKTFKISNDLYKLFKRNRKEFEKIQYELEKIYKSEI